MPYHDYTSLPERLRSRTEIQPDGCWLWTGRRTSNGYGRLGVKVDGRWFDRPAHRLTYNALVGPIPEGLELDHLCRVRLCANPSHLEPVTRRENVLRGVGPAAIHAKKTHCPQGHQHSGVNIRGERICHPCMAAQMREYRAARRAQEAVA